MDTTNYAFVDSYAFQIIVGKDKCIERESPLCKSMFIQNTCWEKKGPSIAHIIEDYTLKNFGGIHWKSLAHGCVWCALLWIEG